MNAANPPSASAISHCCGSVRSYLNRPVERIRQSHAPCWAHLIFLSMVPIMFGGSITMSILAYKQESDTTKFEYRAISIILLIFALYIGKKQSQIYFSPLEAPPYIEGFSDDEAS